MNAAQLAAHGIPGQFRLVVLPDPEPGPDEVVVQVRACGLNRLDLWLEEGALPIRVQLPKIPGSEISGEIITAGANVSGWRTGDRVAIQSNLFCGSCEFCLAGEESLCLKGELLGIHQDGGFADKVLAPARSLVGLPESVDFKTSAALTLAGSTAMHMLTNRAQVQPGHWVLVIAGASGVGSAAIQIAQQLGAHVIATASTEAKRELALRLGAAHVVHSSDPSWPAQVRKITDKRGVDLIIEHVGGAILEQAFDCLARGGIIVTCGATAGRDVRLNLWPFFVKQHRLVGSYGRSRADLTKTLDWAANGRLKAAIDAIFPLHETPAAFARLRDRSVLGKIVIAP
ncbi:MAG: zinc-binding dehydrogenase [Verrucomicrobia bacterium]|nr:zinc-binding dehydrogenase [Verrucomicrobiota bacterium]